MLGRLEREGLLTSRLEASPSGPARKYYRPTAAGHAHATTGVAAWRELGAVVEAVVDAQRGDVMSAALSMADRVRRWSYLQDLELWLEPMANRRRREIVRELRSSTADAAADVGMAQAISDLGRPRDLAREYVNAEPRRRPTGRSAC